MISFITNVYDKDVHHVLKDDSFFLTFKSELIKEKILLINNLTDIEPVYSKMKNYPDIKVMFVDDYAKDAINFFNLGIDKNSNGYYYTIQNFVSIMVVSQPYMLFYTPDVKVFSIGDDFLKDSIDIIDKDNRVMTTTIPWYDNYEVGYNEQKSCKELYNLESNIILDDLENFYYSWCFSDQIFLSSVDKLKNAKYDSYHSMGQNFPGYGGPAAFEKRVCNYQLVNKYYRLIYKKYRYTPQ